MTTTKAWIKTYLKSFLQASFQRYQKVDFTYLYTYQAPIIFESCEDLIEHSKEINEEYADLENLHNFIFQRTDITGTLEALLEQYPIDIDFKAYNLKVAIIPFTYDHRTTYFIAEIINEMLILRVLLPSFSTQAHMNIARQAFYEFLLSISAEQISI